jgi:ABC-type transporter Mla subunit MlaD
VKKMADRSGSEGSDRPRTPLWVQLFGAAALVVVLLLALVLLAGGGGHGPGRHTGWTRIETASAAARQ